jgi:hypothetical protein
LKPDRWVTPLVQEEYQRNENLFKEMIITEAVFMKVTEGNFIEVCRTLLLLNPRIY